MREGNVYFKSSKFNSPGQKDFRYAVREAMRISMAQGHVFSDDLIEMVKAFDTKNEEPWELSCSSTCTRCKGGESSGPILYCKDCNVAPDPSIVGDNGSGVAIHFHCLDTPQSYRDCTWYCDPCCKLKGLKPGTIIDAVKKRLESSKIAGDSNSSAAASSPNHKKRKETSSSNDGKEVKDKNQKKRKERSDTEDSGSGSLFAIAEGDEREIISGGKKGTRGHVPVVPPGISSLNLYGMSNGTRYQSGSKDDSDSDSNADISNDTMDYCFVCGDGGTLVLCDFPHCPRAYHQACVAPTFPQALDESPSSASDVMDEPWFCPSHCCNVCGVLQATPNLDTKFLTLPKQLCAQLMAEKQRYMARPTSAEREVSQTPNTLKQAELVLCHGCPFSICQTCECEETAEAIEHSRAIGTGDKSRAPSGYFHSTNSVIIPAHIPASSVYKLPLQGGSRHYCQHCAKPSQALKLSRVLEMAWSRMCQSRCALPFMLPFLRPGEADDNTDAKNILVHDEWNFPEQKTCFVKILEDIRTCKYQTSAEFLQDVKSVRGVVEQAYSTFANMSDEKKVVPVKSSEDHEAILRNVPKYAEIVQSGLIQNVQEVEPHPYAKYFPSSEEKNVLVNSFDTALRLCESVLSEKRTLLARLESELNASKGTASLKSAESSQSSEERNDAPFKKCKIESSIPVALESCSSSHSGDNVFEQEVRWRSECETELSYRASGYPRKRLMGQWVDYLQGGQRKSLNAHSYSSDIDNLNPSVSHVIRSVVDEEGLSSALYGYGMQTTGRIGSMNSSVIDTQAYSAGISPHAFGTVYQDYDFRQFDAEQALYNLKGSLRNENVTLLEANEQAEILDNWNQIQESYDKHSQTSKASKMKHSSAAAAASSGNVFTPHGKRALKVYSEGYLNEYLATDETLVMLDRLKEMTRKSLHLEARLRREYLATKQFARETGIQKINIGELPIVREMKLANDDLRWRLSQKNRALTARDAMVKDLQAQLEEANKRLSTIVSHTKS